MEESIYELREAVGLEEINQLLATGRWKVRSLDWDDEIPVAVRLQLTSTLLHRRHLQIQQLLKEISQHSELKSQEESDSKNHS